MYVGVTKKAKSLDNRFYFIGLLIYNFSRICLFKLASKLSTVARVVGVKTGAVFINKKIKVIQAKVINENISNKQGKIGSKAKIGPTINENEVEEFLNELIENKEVHTDIVSNIDTW